MRISENLLLCISGVGAQNAEAAARQLLHHGVQCFVSWGVAAGLHPEVPCGMLILPRVIRDYFNRRYHVDSQAHQRLGEILSTGAPQLSICKKPLISGAMLLRTMDEKNRILNEYQVIAADMESVAIARVAEEHNLGFVVVRAIADTAAMSLPEAVQLSANANGEIKTVRYLSHLLPNPGDWMKTYYLARNFAKARKTLITVRQCAQGTLF